MSRPFFTPGKKCIVIYIFHYTNSVHPRVTMIIKTIITIIINPCSQSSALYYRHNLKEILQHCCRLAVGVIYVSFRKWRNESGKALRQNNMKWRGDKRFQYVAFKLIKDTFATTADFSWFYYRRYPKDLWEPGMFVSHLYVFLLAC